MGGILSWNSPDSRLEKQNNSGVRLVGLCDQFARSHWRCSKYDQTLAGALVQLCITLIKCAKNRELFCKSNSGFRFFASLRSSHDFLSVIFGILRKFRIGIGLRNFCGRKIFRRKKIQNIFVETYFWPNNTFWVENFLIETNWSKNWSTMFSSNKVFSDEKIFRPTFFRSKNFRPKKKFRPKLFFDKNVLGFLKKYPTNCFGYIFRSEILPRFKKSHLEQRAAILKNS